MEADAGTGVGGAGRDCAGAFGSDGRSRVAHVLADHSAGSDSYDDCFEGQSGGSSAFTIFEPPAVRKFDPSFNTDTETYEGSQVFFARIELKKDLQPGPVTISFVPRYQTCSGTQCIPPRTREVSATLNVVASAPAAAINIPAGYIEAKQEARKAVVASSAAAADGGLGGFLVLAFGFGLAAIFTPCVFPMIPITMSYFVGQRGGLRQAVVFCLGIIVLFSGLGLVLTLALGPAAVIQLGSNAWVNGFIALIFFVFGLSLLGAFEITIPSGVLTKLNAASGQGGFVGTLLMGLDVRAGFVRVRGAVHGNASRRVGWRG